MNRKLKNTKRLWLGLKTVSVDISTTKIYFFDGNTFDENKQFSLDEAKLILKEPKFDNNKPTVFYLHGYVETMEVESVHVIVDAYIKRNDHNILVLDWADLADGNYVIDAVPNLAYLGNYLSDILIEMFKEGLDSTKLHIVGHSLGSQMAGYIGKNVYTKSQKQIKIKRISALDPAFPLFYPSIYHHLSKDDAELVDIIHTDAWLYGSPGSYGTVDFWPNRGKTLQPGCPKRNYVLLSDNDLSSHRRSWFFWAESVATKEPTFHAVKCPNWKKFQTTTFNENEETNCHMGIDCKFGVTGDYYLQTNGESPFSKGVAGMNFQK